MAAAHNNGTAGILIDLQQMLELAYEAQFTMRKVDRVIIGDKLIEHIAMALSYFQMAYGSASCTSTSTGCVSTPTQDTQSGKWL